MRLILGMYSDVSQSSVQFNYGEATFFLYDHLGNTRVSYSKLDSGLMVHSLTDYFPYGKILREYVSTRPRYLTTQHERDTETDLDYRGARYYDSEYGRFLSIDPLANKYPSISPYVYVADNPIIFVDPSGKSPEPVSATSVTYTIKLIELDVLTGNDVYSTVTFKMTAVKYDDGSISYGVATSARSEEGVGASITMSVNAQGVVTGNISFSDGSKSESETKGVSVSIPGAGASVSSSNGVTLNGESTGFLFQFVYSPKSNDFKKISVPTESEMTHEVETRFEDADTFPKDGTGILDNQELKIEMNKRKEIIIL